ncbi:MAG: flagellar biosynthetic protein FliR [Candidatus Eremiobacteraeota bacterium]|nr:flagellar biosynthetic protein FliR [Candidatus Eremiobacteraeota bacterium]
MSATLTLVFARAVGFVARAPGFRANVPAPLRAGFALLLACAVIPNERVPPADAATFALLVAGEVLVGALLAFAAALVSECVACAGRLLDDFAGVRAALPGTTLAPAGFGGLWSLVFWAAFFAFGGIELTILAFARSFELLPIGHAIDGRAPAAFSIAAGVGFFHLAFDLALPALATGLVVHLSLGALGRVVPRFGNPTLAFPAAFAVVLLAGFAALPAIEQLAVRPLGGLQALFPGH